MTSSPAPAADRSPPRGPAPGGAHATADDIAAARAALARCAGDAAAFLDRGPEGGPHLARRAGPYDDLLSLDDVDAVLTGGGLRHPAVRLVRDGEAIPLTQFTRPSRTGRTRTDDLIDPGRVLDLLAGGATVVLQALQRWWPPLTRFCRHLEVALGHPVQANAYLTPAGAAGLAPHHDTHDVFILQVTGTKHWCLREPVLASPLARHRSNHDDAAARPVLFETDLAPGDALWLPRGVVHAAAAQERLSLHLTLGVLATTAHDVLRRVLDRAADDPAFRADLPPGWAFDRDIARRAVATIVDDLVSWLGDVETDAIADDLSVAFLGGRQPLLRGQVGEIAGLEHIDDATVVRRRPGTLCTLGPAPPAAPGATGAGAAGTTARPGTGGHRGGPRLRLGLGDRHLDMPAVLEPAVRRLLDGRPRAVGDLADLLDRASRTVLVRRLVREGALVTAAAPGAAAHRVLRWPSD